MESLLLNIVDLPFNCTRNGGYRDVEVPYTMDMGQSFVVMASSLPVIKPELLSHADAVQALGKRRKGTPAWQAKKSWCW